MFRSVSYAAFWGSWMYIASLQKQQYLSISAAKCGAAQQGRSNYCALSLCVCESPTCMTPAKASFPIFWFSCSCKLVATCDPALLLDHLAEVGRLPAELSQLSGSQQSNTQRQENT